MTIARDFVRDRGKIREKIGYERRGRFGGSSGCARRLGGRGQRWSWTKGEADQGEDEIETKEEELTIESRFNECVPFRVQQVDQNAVHQFQVFFRLLKGEKKLLSSRLTTIGDHEGSDDYSINAYERVYGVKKVIDRDSFVSTTYNVTLEPPTVSVLLFVSHKDHISIFEVR